MRCDKRYFFFPTTVHKLFSIFCIWHYSQKPFASFQTLFKFRFSKVCTAWKLWHKYQKLYLYVDFEQFLISFFQQVVPVLCGQVWRSLKTKTMPQSHRRPVQSRSASVSAKSKHKSNLRDQAILGPILKMNFFYWWFFEKKKKKHLLLNK